MNSLYLPYLTDHLPYEVDKPIIKKSILRLNKYCKIIIMVFCFFAISTIEVQASHFRYGNISWRVVSGTTVEFKVSMVFRRNYPIFNNPPIGATITPDLTFFHGDGSNRTISLTVTSESISENWFYAEGTFTKTYASLSGVYTAFFEGCCRLSALQNNSDDTYRVETVVNLGSGNTSPVSTLPPILNLPQGVSSATFTIPASDPNGNTLTFSLTPSGQMGSGSSNPAGFSVDAATGIATFNTVGKSVGHLYSASVTINDNNGARIAVDFLIKIATASNPPVFVAPTPASGTIFTVDAGQPLLFDVKAKDPDASDVVTLQVVGLPPTAVMTPTLPTSGAAGSPVESSFSWTPPLSSVGTHIINFTAEDNNGAQATSSVTIVVNACNISLAGTSTNVTCVGGSDGSITLTPTGGTAPFEYSIDNGVTYQSSNEFTGVSVGTYTAVVKDANGCTDNTSVEVIQHNDLPLINSLTGGPTDPISISSATISMSANVTDDNLSSAIWNWGDGETSTVVSPGSTINGTHTYLATGVYRVTLTVTDVCGETDSEIFEYVVVYDPNGGFVTGGGWIHSPAGAYAADLLAEGKANFGFVSKYKKGATIPDGQTQFQFHAVNFNFHSTAYEWLVVAGYKAQYKGEGTINGVSGYGFILSAVDGAKKSSTEPDRFRIKIWDQISGDVVYDNQMGHADDAEANLALSGGSIVIHDAKGKNARYDDATAANDALGEKGLETPFAFKLNVYPNPLQKELSIELESETEEEVTISIYDLLGRRIYEQKQEVAKGANQIILDVDSWKVTTNQLLFRLQTPSKGLHQLILIKPE